VTGEREWVTVSTAQNEWEAEVTRQRLEAVDIPALLEPGDARAYMGASSAFSVKVPADRVTDAQDALQATKGDSDADDV
jgi:hypothetical protein